MTGCPTPYKEAYLVLEHAKLAAKSLSFAAGTYRCECGAWHVNGGHSGDRLTGVPSRHKQRSSKDRPPDPSAARPLGEAALKVDKILDRSGHRSTKPDQQSEHVCRYRPLRTTADGLGVVEVCKKSKCGAYRVVYPGAGG